MISGKCGLCGNTEVRISSHHWTENGRVERRLVCKGCNSLLYRIFLGRYPSWSEQLRRLRDWLEQYPKVYPSLPEFPPKGKTFFVEVPTYVVGNLYEVRVGSWWKTELVAPTYSEARNCAIARFYQITDLPESVENLFSVTRIRKLLGCEEVFKAWSVA